MANKKSSNTLTESIAALKGTIAAAHIALPGVVLVFVLASTILIWIAIQATSLMMGAVVFIVVVGSVLIYKSTSNYGEAILALVAGLLTAFTVSWDAWNFIMFSGACLSFSIFALMISSLRLASAVEDIYRQAALSISADTEQARSIEQTLKTIGKESKVEILGPVERAEVIRIFAFRKMPVQLMGVALEVSGTLVVITKLDYKSIALFVADVYRVFGVENGRQAKVVVDHVYSIIRDVPTSPQEFLQAYENSRSLVLTLDIAAITYFQALRSALERGVIPGDMREVLTRELQSLAP